MPDLSNPLGPPKIITGTEYMDALARLGWNKDNISSPLPGMIKTMQAASSFIDTQYDNAMKWQLSKAQAQEQIARANNIDEQTDFLNRTQDLRYQQQELANKQADQTLRFAEDRHPIDQRILENNAKQGELTNQEHQRNVDDQNQALNDLSVAQSEMPSTDAPDYAAQRDAWRVKWSKLFSNPATSERIQKYYNSVDGVYQGKSSTQLDNDTKAEARELQKQNWLPSAIDIDANSKNPQFNDQMIRARMASARHQIDTLASQLPAGSERRKQLESMSQDVNEALQSEDAESNVRQNKHGMFDSNGRLTGVAQGALIQAQQDLARQQAELGAKPTSDLRVGVGKPNVKGEYPQYIDIKGLTPEAAIRYGERFGGTEGVAGQKQMTDEEKVRDIQKRFMAGKINEQQFKDELRKAFPGPAPIRQPGMPGSEPAADVDPEHPEAEVSGDKAPDYEGRVRPSNNAYIAPRGAADVAGIDANVWQNVMSEEGPEFGKDGKHDSVFGLWADTNDIESNAYNIVRREGPHSLEAYNAVTHSWLRKFLGESQPWKLTSPGMQEMVIADSQHRGGASARAIIDRMGGWDAINRMNPQDAIVQYSEYRKPLWPGNNKPFPDGATDRVTRERAWALRHDTLLSGGQRVAKMQSGGLVSGQSGTDQVPAMLTSGEYVVNKDAVQDVGLPVLEALNRGSTLGGTRPSEWGSLPSISPKTSAPVPTTRPATATAQTATATPEPETSPSTTTAQSSDTVNPLYSDRDAFLNAHYLGDGRLAGLATNFGHDVNGKPDTYMLSKLGGASRIGAFGTDVVNPDTAGASIPIQTFRAFIGDPRNPDIRKAIKDGLYQVEVQAPGGQTVSFPIVDLGPGKGEKASLDLTGSAMRQLGVSDNFPAVYRIVKRA